MEWKKAPPELVDFIMEKMKGKNCDYRKMFGYPAFFINGNMFVGLHGDRLVLRLSDSDISALKKDFCDVVSFEPMPGRIMKSYVVLPRALYLDDAVFTKWLNKSMDYVSNLPPKKAKRKAD